MKKCRRDPAAPSTRSRSRNIRKHQCRTSGHGRRQTSDPSKMRQKFKTGSRHLSKTPSRRASVAQHLKLTQKLPVFPRALLAPKIVCYPNNYQPTATPTDCWQQIASNVQSRPARSASRLIAHFFNLGSTVDTHLRDTAGDEGGRRNSIGLARFHCQFSFL